MRHPLTATPVKLILAVLLLFFPYAATADDSTWDGTGADNLWATIENWLDGILSVPGTGNNAIFGDSNNGKTLIDLGTTGGTQNIGDIIFNGTNQSYTLGDQTGGADILQFDGGGRVTINNSVTANQTIAADILLGDGSAGTFRFANNSGSAILRLAGNVDHGMGTSTPGTTTLRFEGNGSHEFAGTVSDTGDASRFDMEVRGTTLSITGSTDGIDRLNIRNDGSVTYETGAIADPGRHHIQAGTLTLNSAQTIGDVEFGGNNASSGGNATLILNADITQSGTWDYFDDGNTGSDASTALVTGTGDIIINGATRTIGVDDNPNVAGAELTIAVNVRGNNANGRNLQKADLGTLAITGRTSQINQFRVQAGRLELTNFGNDDDLVLGDGTTTGTLVYTGAGETVNGNTKLRIGDDDETAGDTGGGVLLNNGTGGLRFLNLDFNEALTGETAARTLELGGNNTGGDNISLGSLVDNDTALGGTVGLIKSGSNVWKILGAATNISGGVDVQNGRLDIFGNVGGSLTVADGAAIGGEATYGSATFGSTGPVNLFVDGSTLAALTVSGGATNTSQGVVVQSDSAVGGFGAFTILDYDQAQTNNVDQIHFSTSLASSARPGAAAFNNDAANGIVTLDLGYANNVWKATTSNAWDINTSANWENPTDALYFDGDSTTFDDTATSFTPTLVNNIAPGQVIFNNDTNNYTLSSTAGEILTIGGYGLNVLGGANVEINSELNGNGDITQGDGDGVDDTSKLTLTADNSNWTGEVFLQEGDLQIDHINGLGNDPENTVHLIDLGDNPKLIISAEGTFANNIEVQNIGAGKTIEFDDGGNNASKAATMTGTITQYETLSALTIDVEGNNVGDDSNNHILTIEGQITSPATNGDGPINKIDQGSLYLANAANNFSGPLQVNQGKVFVESIGNIGESSHAGAAHQGLGFHIRLGSGGASGDAGNIFNNTGTLVYIGSADESTDRIVRIGASGNTQSAPGSSGGGIIRNNGTGSLTFTNAVFNSPEQTSANRISARTLSLEGTYTGTNEIQGVIADNYAGTDFADETVAITVNTSGTWALSGTNTYTGATTVSAGTLLINGASAAASAVNVDGGSLGGAGTINGTVTIGATSDSFHTAGSTATATSGDAATQTIANTLTYGNNATVSWDIISNSSGAIPAGQYDQFNLTTGTGDLAFGSELELNIHFGSDVDLNDAFWNANLNEWLVWDTGQDESTLLSSLTAMISTPSDPSYSSAFRLQAGAEYDTSQGAVNGVWLVQTAAIPEPSTFGLMGLGLAGFAWCTRRRRIRQTTS